MKIILVSIFFLISFFKYCGKINPSNNDGMLKVDKIIGTKEDLKKVFFLIKDDSTINQTRLTIKYEQNLGQLSFLNDDILIGYYHIKKGKEIIINNYSPLRNKISFNDLREREYRLKIKLGKDKLCILKIENYGNRNKLAESITIFAHDQGGNFDL